MGTIVYHAVIRAQRPPGAVLQVRWGEASPDGIQELCNALVIAALGQALEVEIRLTGDGKESVAPELQHRFARLRHEGVSVRWG